MNTIHRRLAIVLLSTISAAYALPPLGMFVPYDINIKLKKPVAGHFQLNVLGEKSYHVHGWATDYKEEETFCVDVLQIYEPVQNVVSLYQGYDASGTVVQTLTTPFTQLLDSIAGGPGGGVSNFNNGIFQPTGKLSCGQVALSSSYGVGRGFYISAYLPFYFTKLSHTKWHYAGTNTLFSDQKIQEELITTFAQDAQKYFDLNIGNWNRKGLGDLTIMAEWQRDFIQQRPTLKNVQTMVRLGISLPTSLKNCDTIILPIAFGADGAIGIPFGGGISINLGNVCEVGFSGQFWYYWSNEKIRRIKTFPTQTTLLYPVLTKTYKEFSIIQNFNLHALLYSFCKRFTLKGFYQYWRKGEDRLIPLSSNFNFDIVNSSRDLEEETRHQFCVLATYSPLKGDFEKYIPQFEIFWKTTINGTRTAAASTYGAQFSLIF